MVVRIMSDKTCITDCIRFMTTISAIPHFFDTMPAETAWSFLRKTLSDHGLNLALNTVENPFEDMALNNPSVEYLLLCQTAVGNHAVVCKNGVIIYDPSPYKHPVVGKHSLGIWIVGYIVKNRLSNENNPSV